MEKLKRGKTKYPGVTYREKERLDGSGLERTYYIRYRRGGRGTKEIEEPVGKESEGMTAAKANKIRAMRAAGVEQSNAEKREAVESENLASTRHTIFKLWEIYAEHHKEISISRADRSNIRYLSSLYDKLPENLATSDVDDLRAKLLMTPSSRKKNGKQVNLSPQSVKHVLGLLNRILHFAERRGICPYPSNMKISMPRIDNKKTENMTNDQMRRYLIALDEEPDQDSASFLRIALYTGMRKNAIINLKWDDIDFEHQLIILRGEHAKKGKTETIPLTESVARILSTVTRTDSPYIFPGKDGGKRQDFRSMARRIRDKAGLPPDFRPLHGLRHTYASFLASSGKVDIYALQKLLTHESPEMTARYAHLADEAMKRAASVADEMQLLSNPGERQS